MTEPFFEQPVLNSPYECPSRHWELDEAGQPTRKVIEGRRPVRFFTPIPKPKKRRGSAAEQAALVFDEGKGLSTAEQQYEHTAIIDEVRRQVERWRSLPSPEQWQVTPETARLLRHWRGHRFSGVRPFFCQIEAVETVIWLTEAAPRAGRVGRRLLDHLANANHDANPHLPRLALKLATGAGKTTVMAMLIAWQTPQRGPPAPEQPVHPRVPGGGPRPHHQGPPAGAANQRPVQLLPEPGAGPRRHAPGPGKGQDRRHQLPRLQETRPHGAFQGRALPAPGTGRTADDPGDRGADAATGHARAHGPEGRHGPQRRGPPLLSGKAGREAGGPAHGGGEARGRKEPGSRPVVGLRAGSGGQEARPQPGGGPLRDPLLPARFGLCRRDAVSLDPVRLLAHGRHRVRHREAAAGSGGRQRPGRGHAQVPQPVGAHPAEDAEAGARGRRRPSTPSTSRWISRPRSRRSTGTTRRPSVSGGPPASRSRLASSSSATTPPRPSSCTTTFRGSAARTKTAR